MGLALPRLSIKMCRVGTAVASKYSGCCNTSFTNTVIVILTCTHPSIYIHIYICIYTCADLLWSF